MASRNPAVFHGLLLGFTAGPSDFWLEDTDYLRLKNISVGYTLPKSPYFDKLRIYATGQNVLTWTNYSGLDPEVSNRGVDGGQYPVQFPGRHLDLDLDSNLLHGNNCVSLNAVVSC